MVQRLCPELHQRLLHRQQGFLLQGRPLLGLRPEDEKVQQGHLGPGEGRQGDPQAGHDPEPPALRLPDDEEALTRATRMDKVSSITGVSKEDLIKVYAAYSATGVKDKAGTECYALGWTHHTTGSQIIRTMSIIQLLLGNMGICRRRRQCASRRAQRPGLHGSRDPLQHPARLPEDARGIPGHAGQIPREEHAQVQRSPVGELLSELPQVHGQFPQGPLRGQGNGRKRLLLFLASQAR